MSGGANPGLSAFIVRVQAKAGLEAEVEAALAEMGAAVMADEPGAVFYGAYRGTEPGSYVIVEHYRDEEALAAHRASPHFQRLRPAIAQMWAEPPTVTRITPLAS